MSKTMVLIRKEFLEQWRTKKILILCIIFVFVAIASPIIAKITPEILKTISIPGLSINLPDPTYKDSLDQFIKNISQIALLVIVFVIAGAVSDEKAKKTLEIILTKPISRVRFIFSKFISYFFSIAIIFTASSVIFYVYTVTAFGAFSFINFSLMALVVLLYIFMVMAITILASTIVNNSIIAGVVGFIGSILFGVIFDLFEGIKRFSPNLIFSNYQDVVSKGWDNELIYPMIIILSIIAISIITAISAFRHQEIER